MATTEVETLRALLAEARRAVVNERLSALERMEIRARIDAALAEPVRECENCVTLRGQYLDAVEELVPLRAQAKRLKALYLDARADGWRDGAKAMRAQASGCAAERARYWAETSASEGGVPMLDDRAEEARYIADDIRGLLMPEDKP